MFRLFQDPHLRLHLKQGSKFIVCGLLGAAMEFSILAVLVGRLNITPFIAYIFSAGIPAVFVFFFNRYVTFRSTGDRMADQTGRFIAVYATAFVLNYALSATFYTVGSHYLLGATYAGYTFQHDHIAYGAKVVAIGITAIWNYFFSHYFIFRRKVVPVEAEVAGFI
ncbi:MAG: GtrA family protein [Candidatus Peribacteraceae bacterium]